MTPELLAALAQVNKDHGAGTIMRVGDAPVLRVPVISSGSPAIDAITGIGGFPKGRIIEIYGAESGGKTTLTLQLIAQAQKQGGVASFIDAEHALDLTYAAALGVDVPNLLLSQPDNGEQALEVAEAMVIAGVNVVVVDSVAALVPRAELEGDMGDSQMGLHARLMSQAMRKLMGAVARSGSVLVFVNQVREKIGILFGSPETTPGGRALKFAASLRIDIRKTTAIAEGTKENKVRTGTMTKVRIVKNKMAAPFRECEVELFYGRGISREADLLKLGAEQNILEKSGTWYSFKGERLGQGKDGAMEFLHNNPEVAGKIEKALREILFPWETAKGNSK